MNKISVLSLLFAAVSLLGCNTDGILEPDTPINPDYSIFQKDTIWTEETKGFKDFKRLDYYSKDYFVVGDTIVTFIEPKLPPIAKNVDVSALKSSSNKDQPFRYVAIGSTTASGYRDGGYFNEGILTSYPNLLARQLGVENFRQPLFSTKYYNGFGRKVVTTFNPTGGPVTKFKEARNNLAVLSAETFELESYRGKLDNFSIPMARRMILFNEDDVVYDIKQNSSAKASLDRILGSRREFSSVYNKMVKENKFDFITIDFNTSDIHDQYFSSIPPGEYPQDFYTSAQATVDQQPKEYGTGGGLFPLYVSPALQIVRNMDKLGVKAVLLNVPDENLTWNRNYVSVDLFEKMFGKNHFIYIKGETGDFVTTTVDYFSFDPKTEIDSLLGNKVHLNLKKGISYQNPMTKNYLRGNPLKYEYFENDNMLLFNRELDRLGNRFGFPVVDINSLYKNIYYQKYQSWDGVQVTPELFYSSDGIFPSALGNAVIANEIIKVLNSHYGLDIPYIETRQFLNK